MSTFSLKSADSRFDFELQHSEENKPSKLIITVNDSVGEPASVLELAKAIYDYCFGKRTNSFNLKGIKELPCEIRCRGEWRYINISHGHTFVQVLICVSKQIGI